MAIKAKAGEDLSDANVQRVIDVLETITKKEACQMLKIAYNTTRLKKIIDEYNEKQQYAASRRKQLRNKPLDSADKKYIVQEYLSGMSISAIADSIYRSTKVVKNVLLTYNVPVSRKAFNYLEPAFLEDDSIRDNYNKNDLVFSAVYGVPAYVSKKVGEAPLGGPAFRVWLFGDHCRWAVQPYYELADLTKLQKTLDIKIEEMDSIEIKRLIYEGLMKAKKK